jgi:hypothetical protein
MALSDALSLLSAAAQTLAEPEGTPRQRLYTAAMQSLTKVSLHERFMPPPVRELYHRVHRDLTRVRPAGAEGSVTATLRVMTDAEAERLTGAVLALEKTVRRFLAAGRRPGL